jgi:hypothetical protein
LTAAAAAAAAFTAAPARQTKSNFFNVSLLKADNA